MHTSLTALAVAVLYLASFYGGGAGALRLLGRERSDLASTLGVGLALWIAIGGALNALHIAYAGVVGSLFVASVVPGLLDAFRRRGSWRARFAGRAPLIAVLALVTLIAIAAVPTATFNPVDDFRNYLVVPQRMLQTGTVAGTELDSLGVDGFGAQSFLQSPLLIALPLGYVIAFDNLVCLILGVLLLDRLGLALGGGVLLRAAAGLASVAMTVPQINISALYSGSALTIASALFSGRLLALPDDRGERPASACAGLTLAGLAALKTPCAVFATLWLVGLLAVLVRRARYRAGVWLFGSFALSIAPWLVPAVEAHGPAILERLLAVAYAPTTGGSLAGLLRTRASAYGGSFAYSWTVLALGVVALALAARSTGERVMPFVDALTAAFVALALATVALTAIVDAEHAVRYLGAVSAATVLGAVLACGAQGSRRRRSARPVAALVILACIGGASAPEAFVRARNLLVHRFVFTYPLAWQDLPALRRATGPDARAFMRGLQARTAPGSVVFASVGMPFHLDFARNAIISLHDSALGAPWVRIPTEDAAALYRYFRSLGIRYVITQRAGIGVHPLDYLARVIRAAPSPRMREIARRELALRTSLADLAAEGIEIYRDELFTILDLARR